MKRLVALLLASIFSTLFSGCVKNLYDGSDKIPGGGSNPFGDTKVSPDFDWSMTNNVRLTVEPFDSYNGQYDYLVEIFKNDPEKPDAQLLATGSANKSFPFSKLIVYPKGVADQIYIRQTDPAGFKTTKIVTLVPGVENAYAFDSTSVVEKPISLPQDQRPTANPVFYYTMLIEDSFPDYGDYDFNDVVMGVRMETVSNGKYMEKVLLSVEFRALGATKRSGAYFSLPTFTAEDIQSVKMNGWEINPEGRQSTPVYILSDDLHALFNYSGEITNTLEDIDYRGSITRTVELVFTPDKITDFSPADFDLFTTTLKREGEKLRTEIHSRNFTYTERGVRYQYHSKDNYVWALLIPEHILYPKEHAFIGTAYPEIKKWISGNNNMLYWYQNHTDGEVYTKEK